MKTMSTPQTDDFVGPFSPQVDEARVKAGIEALHTALACPDGECDEAELVKAILAVASDQSLDTKSGHVDEAMVERAKAVPAPGMEYTFGDLFTDDDIRELLTAAVGGAKP